MEEKNRQLHRLHHLEHYLMILGIAVGALILTCAGLLGRRGIYRDYAYSYADAPLLQLALTGMADGVMPFTEAEYTTVYGDPEADNEAGYDVVRGEAVELQPLFEEPRTEAEPEPDESDVTEVMGEDEMTEPEVSDEPEEEAPAEPEEAEAPVEPEEEIPAEPEVYELEAVTDDYFCDALFLGDSRTVGLSEYCAPLDERAVFFAKVSLTIFTLMNKVFIPDEERGTINVETALADRQYDKIYLMIGINEMGTGNTEYFLNAYTEVIEQIRALQPDALIYIQSIMHVTKAKSDAEKHINNANIDLRNSAIATLANDHDIFYLNMNEAVDDEDGALRSELTFDGVHLKAKSYELWYDYLKNHAVVRAQDEIYRQPEGGAAAETEEEAQSQGVTEEPGETDE